MYWPGRLGASFAGRNLIGDGKDRRDVLVQFTATRTDLSTVGFWAPVHPGCEADR
jgi:hypothetical protein